METFRVPQFADCLIKNTYFKCCHALQSYDGYVKNQRFDHHFKSGVFRVEIRGNCMGLVGVGTTLDRGLRSP